MSLVTAPPRQSLNIAVIGSGIAGLSAAWLLNQHHTVTVYEKNARLGGHSNTVDVPAAGSDIAVDTGFIVYNQRNYPNLTALFDHLEVPTKASDMSFAASLDGGAFEYSGTSLNGLFGQRRNLVRPRFWRMLRDITRFYREVPGQLPTMASSGESLGAFVERAGYGADFVRDHLLPMGAAIWSTTAREMRAYPAAAFVRFFESHGLLRIADRPQWRTVDGGSRSYVNRLSAPFRQRIRHHAVRDVTRFDGGVLVTDTSGETERYDHVVIAAHADEAYRMLSDPDPRERQVLGAWRYTNNRAVLHGDHGLMPRRQRVWSSWNFIGGPSSTDADERLCVTYWMNKLQSIDPARPLFVTLNPVREPDPETVVATFDYTHPYFDSDALRAQRSLWSLQGRRRTWFCGSYFGYGFHEDALQSGLAVAEQLGGARRPWTVAEENGRIQISETAGSTAVPEAA